MASSSIENIAIDQEHENEFLNNFFTHISHYSFDKAKERLDKEKETCRSIHHTPWTLLLNHLPQIILAEKSYIDLGSLTVKNKGFLRKENYLRAIYDSLRSEMKRLEDVVKISHIKEESSPIEKHFISHIAEFITARIDLIDFYEKLCLLGNLKYVKYEPYYQHILSIYEKHKTGFSHIALTPIKAVVNIEIEILMNLMGSLDQLQTRQFIPSITFLYEAHTRLTAWEQSLQNRESWKLGFLKSNTQPLLFQWMMKLKGAAVSKFSLYFHNILAQQTTPNEMKQLCTKQQIDYFFKLQTFQRRYDVLFLSLIFDQDVEESTKYSDSFSLIVSCSQANRSISHFMGNFESIVKERMENASLNYDRIIYEYVSKDNCTYVITDIEPRIYILLIFENKRTEKDTFIAHFLQDLCSQLRFTKHFLTLKIPLK